MSDDVAMIVRRITTAAGVLDLRSTGHADLVPKAFSEFSSRQVAGALVTDAAALYAMFVDAEAALTGEDNDE